MTEHEKNELDISNEALEKLKTACIKHKDNITVPINAERIIEIINEIKRLRIENAHLKELLQSTEIFIHAVGHISQENWEPALKARIEELEAENHQLDEAYTNARVILDKENTELRKENARLEKEADWLVSKLCHHARTLARKCDPYDAHCVTCGKLPTCELPMSQFEWREAARKAVEEQCQK